MTQCSQGSRRPDGTAPRYMTVIFKGSNRCNARCRFCAVGDPTGERVKDDDFEHLATSLGEYIAQRRLTHLEFNFHGGEPTLLGEAFLDKACARIRELPVEVTFSMQSNLLHIAPGIIDIVKKYGIRLGTSIDPLGTGRLDGCGNDAYPAWLKSYLAVSKEISPPGAIFVVTREALGQARRLIDAAEEISAAIGSPFGLQINPVYPQGKARGASGQLITPEAYGRFLIELWRLWETRGAPVKLTPIQQFVARMDSPADDPPPLSCSFQGCCASTHVGVDFHLNVAGCGRRLDSGAYFGNLRDNPLARILKESEERRLIGRRSEALRGEDGPCRDCRFFDMCNGGCPDDAAIALGDISSRFQWCDAYRALFEAIEGRRLGRPAGSALRIHAIADPGDAFELAYPYGPKELWVLPAEDGRNLRFESGLGRLGDLENARIRLWVHNRHVQHLSLWERLLNRPRVSVVLFELEGLQEALARLNDMSAHITLDSIAILESDAGSAALGRLLERFLFERRWRSKVYPFTRILMHRINTAPVSPTNRFGLTPGEIEIVLSPSAETGSPAAKHLLACLAKEAGTLQVWKETRSYCLSCDVFDACGGIFSTGDGKPCSPGARKLIDRLREVGDEIRAQWNGSFPTAPPSDRSSSPNQ